MKERHIFIKVIEGEKVVSFIHFTIYQRLSKDYFKMVKKGKTQKPPIVNRSKE